MSEILAGQVWRDWDVRYREPHRERLLRVIVVGMTHAVMENTRTGKRSMVALQRMRPTATGYKLVSQPPAEGR